MNEEKKVDFNGIGKNIGNGFAQSIKDFKVGFRETQQQQIDQCIQQASAGYNYQFISFNYTRVLDECINEARKVSNVLGQIRRGHALYDNSLGRIIHVHGYADGNMVLGVNDETQIKNIELFEEGNDEDISQLIKRKTNIMNEEHVDEKTMEILNSSDLIYIYGMSIGATDEMWWKQIGVIMLQKPNLRVIIHRHDNISPSLFNRKFRKYEREQRNLLTRYFDIDEKLLDSVENRIHITNSNIFERLDEIANKQKYEIKDKVQESGISIEPITKEDIDKLFQVEGETLIIGKDK